MYVPKRFQAPGDSAIREVLAATDFAPLISVQQGAVQVAHLPVLYREQGGQHGGGYGIFRAHFARANPHWQHLEDGEVLVICQGPHGYISPAWYRDREVPTWDYIAVHAYCEPRIIHDQEELKAIVRELMDVHETRTGTGQSYDDYPAEFVQPQLNAIVGVELTIRRIEAAFKLSQNRIPEDRESVCARLRESNDPARAALADAIERYAPKK
ncbi:MAG: FMN-binding negative transcriptional regulator [Gammaproteobacteria bacterium]